MNTRPGHKAFDAPASKDEVIKGLAVIAAKKVQKAHGYLDDIDEAAESGGHLFREWLKELVYNKDFVREANLILGSGQFNSEFFLDGLLGEDNE